MTCTHCGADLTAPMGVKELCYVLSSQYLTFDPSDDERLAYHELDIIYEDVKDCTLHCGECGEDLTYAQTDNVRAVM